MSSPYSEDRLIQETTADFLRDELGWESIYAYSTETYGPTGTLGRSADQKEVVLRGHLKEALSRLNPGLPDTAYDQAIAQLTERPAGKPLVLINKEHYRRIRGGIPVTYKDAQGKTHHPRLRVIDFEDPENNRFVVVRELWVQGKVYRRRPDIIGFVNGLPLLFIELKRSDKDLKIAYTKNLADYKDTIPHIFHHNAFIMVANGIEAKVGSITSRFEHFNEWRRLDEEKESTGHSVPWQRMLEGMCHKERFIDLLESFILFDEGGPNGTLKIIARNHQYLGVNRAFEAVQSRDVRAGKLGVFWHTQGSGKSYSMVFLARKVHRRLSSTFTFLVVTDRIELDNQISKTFAGVGAVTDITQHQAGSGAHLKSLLEENRSYVFTLIQKFRDEIGPDVSKRRDVIVIADEAHRTQYGSLAENMRLALPNASFLAFTGTPLMESAEDQLTRRIFGDYVSTYDFQQAIEDGATVPLHYDNRGEKLGITTDEVNERIAEVLESETLDQDQEEKLRQYLSREYPILTAPERLEGIAKDLAAHFSASWLNGKAMLVCLDKVTCVKMYELISKAWQEEIAKQEEAIKAAPDEQAQREAEEKHAWLTQTQFRVIISESQGEVGTFRKWREVENAAFEERKIEHTWDLDIEHHREVMKTHDCEAQFKKEAHPFRLAIVCAMWLTGFDVPSLSTLYLDKPMKGHTLMQAIARANRVHEGKNNGLLVDYNGMLKSLRAALAKYGQGGQGSGDGGDEPDMEALAAQYAEAIEACLGHVLECGFDLKALMDAQGFEKLALLDESSESSAVNAVCQSDTTRSTFETLARDIFKKRRALVGRSDLLRPYRPAFGAINALYKQLQKNKEAADITEVLVKLYGVVGEHLTVTEAKDPGSKSGKLYDISKIDFDRLRQEFERRPGKNTQVQAIKGAVERKVKAMVERNPTRIDFYQRFQEIVEAYNKETDRATIEETFEALVDLVESMGQEEQRIVREGLDEEHAAVFDLILKHKDALPTRARNRVKEVCRGLLTAVKDEIARLQGWRDKDQTQALIKVLIYDYLYGDGTGLPSDFGEEEVLVIAGVIFEHVYSQYESAANNAYVHPQVA